MLSFAERRIIKMKNFVLKRLGQMLLVFVIVSMFSFSIIYFSPGDPLYLYTSPAVSSYKMSDEQLNDMRESLGLNGNVVERYINWAGKMLQGDWCFPNKKILRNSPCLPACKQKNIATRLRDTT